VPRLQRKNFGAPEHTRDLGRGRMDVVDLDETAVGRMILKPGWRWSTDVAPKMGTSTCQVRHLGAAVSGHLHVVVEDGSEMDIQAGDVYEIPPGHDGWVVERHRLYRDFRLGSFTEAISLVDRVAEVAERAGHHPNILVHEWCFVHLELYSHLDGNLSDRDVELAIAIDEMLDDVSGSRAPRRGDARRR